MATSNKRPLAVFKIKLYRRIADFILKVRTIVLNMGNNAAIFVTPVPTLASVTTNVDDLETAESVALTRVAGGVAARDIKYEAVLDDVHDLQGYVQSLADNAVDELTARGIIEASGFNLKVNGAHVRPPLDAKNGDIPGTILLTATGGGPRTSHEWQSSPNGTTWNSLPPTIKAKTEMTGQVKLTTLYFRHRVITKDGPLAWSQTVSVVVL